MAPRENTVETRAPPADMAQGAAREQSEGGQCSHSCPWGSVHATNGCSDWCSWCAAIACAADSVAEQCEWNCATHPVRALNTNTMKANAFTFTAILCPGLMKAPKSVRRIGVMRSPAAPLNTGVR
jgi:hypothetical protein